MNAFPGLTWDFSEQSKTVDFMDMTITIKNSNMIEATLFEKRLNLHLYIPHILPTLQGYSQIVYSTPFRSFSLCSSETDKLQ